MMKEQPSDTRSPSQRVSDSKKQNRLDAMAKISETFGYGDPSQKMKAKKEASKKPSAPTEPRPKKKIQASKEIKQQQLKQLTKKSKSAAVGGVKPWDFGSSPASSGGSTSLLGGGGKSEKGVNVDPELDVMLAKLEMDADFKEMSENDQIAWLESLFFLDTPSKQASSGLVKPRPRELDLQHPSRRPSTLPSTKVDTSSSAAVSSKSLSIQSNSGRNPKSQQQKVTSKQNAESSADELDDCGPSGLNKDKCALAMSFFANDSSGSSTKAAGSKKATCRK